VSPINRKRLQRKRTKWINARASLFYRRRLALTRIMGSGIAAAAMSRINAIRSTPTGSKASKSLAIAETVIDAHSSIARMRNEIMKSVERARLSVGVQYLTQHKNQPNIA